LRVRVAGREYNSEGEPILLILDKEDKDILFRMPGWAKRYLAYPEDMSEEQAYAYMTMEEDND
jgi:hypothetical protein